MFSVNSLLVDCGATTHIINDHSAFDSFDESFDSSKHSIELADSSKSVGIVKGRGHAKVKLSDTNGISHDVFLKDALYVPTFKQNIFSV